MINIPEDAVWELENSEAYLLHARSGLHTRISNLIDSMEIFRQEMHNIIGEEIETVRGILESINRGDDVQE